MKIDEIGKYADRVYGYAIKRTYSEDEADELSQEILFTAVREFPKLRDTSRFEPWLWGIADNVTKTFRRTMGRQRAMYCYDIPEDLTDTDEDDGNEEMYDFLRTKIAMLSAMYRDIILLYYYDGLSTKEISARLSIPEGTVTWRLSEARRKLKKECKEMNEQALRPQTMNLQISGSGEYDGVHIPFPTAYINDALSKNILYHCYEEAHGVEELASLCGVPAYYIEDRVSNLLTREAVIEQVRGKYRTNFVIFSDKYGIYCEENAEKSLLPVTDRVIDALNALTEDMKTVDFYRAADAESDLWYLYGRMAFEYLAKTYCDLPSPPFAKKYDGYYWNYIGNMETGAHPRVTLGRENSLNLGSRGHCRHTVYYDLPGTEYRRMMYAEYINVCEDLLTTGKTEDTHTLTNAIRKGYIVRREDGSFFVDAPYFTMEQMKAFESLVEKHLAPLAGEYGACVNTFLAGYKKLFPKHLREDTERLLHGMYTGLFGTIVAYGLRTEKIAKPTPGYICDVIVQFK